MRLIKLLFLLILGFTPYLNKTARSQNIPKPASFQFSVTQTKILPGKATEKTVSTSIPDTDKIGNLGLVALYYQNGYYTDGRYNHNNYKVEQGLVKNGSTGKKYPAYRVFEPANKSENFVASQHIVCYKFTTKQDYTIYELIGKTIKVAAQVEQQQITTGKFTKIEELSASTIVGNRTWIFVPTNEHFGTFSKLNATTEAAEITKTDFLRVNQYRYQTNFSAAIGTNQYAEGYNRNLHAFNLYGKPTLLWQDSKTRKILLSSVSADYKTITHKEIAIKDDLLLVAASDDLGNFYLATTQANQKNLTLYKLNKSGKVITSVKQNCERSALNVYDIGYFIQGMAWNNGTLAMILARQMHKYTDGLNHQGAIAVLFNDKTLELKQNFGQTSGHSFDNIIYKASDAGFMAIDLGDNYPRGINLHRITENNIRSRVVYTFKTLHGNSTKSPAGKTYERYNEISQNSSFYKWSNDNGTYTELGGLIETADGYMVIFRGEPNRQGKAIDNSRIGKNSDPGQVGFVKIRKNFTEKRGNVVTNDIMLSRGITEQSGFYTFGGKWAEQQNTGLVWLTNYKKPDHNDIVNVKAGKISEGKILVLWEELHTSNKSGTYAMCINENGQIISGRQFLGNAISLTRRNDILVIDSKAYIFYSNSKDKKLEMSVILLNK